MILFCHIFHFLTNCASSVLSITVFCHNLYVCVCVCVRRSGEVNSFNSVQHYLLQLPATFAVSAKDMPFRVRRQKFNIYTP